MAQASIPVDLFNPGQVLACLGFAEVADRVLGGARGAFDWSDPRGVRFRLAAAGGDDPVRAVLDFLDHAEVAALAPCDSPNRVAKFDVPTRLVAAGAPFPTPDAGGVPQLPARLGRGTFHVELHAWADSPQGNGRDNFKLWAGAAGYSGAAFLRDALASARGRAVAAAADPFALSADIGSNLRLDWRGGYVPLDAGFSLNEHGGIAAVGYPLVEVLGQIGLSHARPRRVEKLEYRYAVVGGDGVDLPLPLLRLALGDVPLPFPRRRFTMRLGWPGKKDQARAITAVTEESRP